MFNTILIAFSRLVPTFIHVTEFTIWNLEHMGPLSIFYQCCCLCSYMFLFMSMFMHFWSIVASCTAQLKQPVSMPLNIRTTLWSCFGLMRHGFDREVEGCNPTFGLLLFLHLRHASCLKEANLLFVLKMQTPGGEKRLKTFSVFLLRVYLFFIP